MDLIGRAKRYLSRVTGLEGATPSKGPNPTFAETRKKQGAGFGWGDIGIGGEEGKSSEPAHGNYDHNSPAKPL